MVGCYNSNCVVLELSAGLEESAGAEVLCLSIAQALTVTVKTGTPSECLKIICTQGNRQEKNIVLNKIIKEY